MVFIAGEAGIGKTALLQALFGNIAATGDARFVCGQCDEQVWNAQGVPADLRCALPNDILPRDEGRSDPNL